MSGTTLPTGHQTTCTPSRAARELGLNRSEFELAVHLGRIRTVPDEGGGGQRVALTELERLRGQAGFPDALREGVRTVGTQEGADLLDVPATRFTRLARLGLLVPARFYLNRYRTVVWMYLADELRQFAADPDNTALLTGRTPAHLRGPLSEGGDLRARNWRGRHLGFLLRQAEGPWQRAGAVAALLDPVQIAELVPDPYERAHINRYRPAPPTHSTPGSPAAELAARIMTADDPDEIARLRADLARAVVEAREHHPAPRPTPGNTVHLPAPPDHPPAPTGPDTAVRQHTRTAHEPGEARPSRVPHAARTPHPAHAPHGRSRRPERSRGVFGRLRRTDPPARTAYSALNRPSWTTDTSSRPRRS
ncbi:DUF6397 family protein [Streptomyces sp. NPDC057386]|uniref:DUF6397 family protein n=1 Tax=Streptomyces thermocoprophilus TaxID=78356 RepID=A0ABV5V868_9ACTN